MAGGAVALWLSSGTEAHSLLLVWFYMVENICVT